METPSASSLVQTPIPRPRGRVSRKAMETCAVFAFISRNAFAVREDALAERQWRRSKVSVSYHLNLSRPRGRVSRKAMETKLWSVNVALPAKVVREDALAERQWRLQGLTCRCKPVLQMSERTR